jgi:hypothetical protein
MSKPIIVYVQVAFGNQQHWCFSRARAVHVLTQFKRLGYHAYIV